MSIHKQTSIGVDGSTNKYTHNCDCCKFIFSQEVNGTVYDFYMHKARLGRAEVVWRFGNNPAHQSAVFAEPLNSSFYRVKPEHELTPKARFYGFVYRNNLGHLLNN